MRFIDITKTTIDRTGSTDCSSALQALINAASAADVNELFLPKGVYKCNITVPENFRLYGAGGGFFVNFTIPTAPYNTTYYPTILIPNSTASPVITVASVYGVRLEDFAIIGSTSKLGQGITLSNGVNYCGSNMTLRRVSVRGFDRGLANYGAVDVTHNECMYTCSEYNVYLQKAADNLAPSDNNTFINCVTGGSASTWNFYIKACRGINVIGGDHNLATHIMYMDGGSVVNWQNGNSEQIQDYLFELNAGTLNIQAGRFNVASPGGNKELLRVTGTTVEYSIGPIVYDGTGSGFLSSTYGTLIKTAGSEYPRTCPAGYLLQRYTSTAFSTLKQTEFTTRLFRLLAIRNLLPSLQDEFTQNFTSSPYGNLSWIVTTLGGSGSTIRFPSASIQSLYASGIELVTASASGNDNFKFTPQKEWFSANLFNEWENLWRLNYSNTANVKTRVGLYSNDSFTITGATNASPIVITTSASHGMVDGMQVFQASVGGNTAANGTFYIDVLSSTTYALYTDSGLTTPVAGNGAYTSGGTSNAVTPTHGIGFTFIGGTNTNIQFETIVSGVSTKTDTGIAISTLQSTSASFAVILRRLMSPSQTFLGYAIQINGGTETYTTTALSGVYLIPTFMLGSSTANFATARLDRFKLDF